MKDCSPCTVDVFPLYKKSGPTVVKYDVVDRNPRCKGKKCGSIDVFTLVRKKDKVIVYNKPCTSRFTWTPTVDIFPLVRGSC